MSTRTKDRHLDHIAAGEPARTSAGRGSASLVILLIAAHVGVWTLLPALLHKGLPIDVIEAYAIGPYWVIGTFKHPALPSWLLEASRLATGIVGWPAYLISASAVGLTYWLVYLLGRDTLGERLALAGTLPLTGVIYFSWVTPELNHNVVLMPIWMAAILCLWRARETGRLVWWIALGAIGALGLYAKFAMAVLLLTAAATILIDPKLRRQIAGPGPWAGLIVFAVGVAPLVHWLLATDFQVLVYVEDRLGSKKAGTIGLFLLKQAGSALGLLLILGWALRGATVADGRPDKAGAGRDAIRFLVVMLAAPLLLTIIGAAVMGSGLRGAWGSQMLSLAGLVTVALAADRIGSREIGRIARASGTVLAATALVYGAMSLTWPLWEKNPPKTAWNQRELAQRLEAVWRDRTGKPLGIVAGDLFVGGIVSMLGNDRATLLIDGDLAKSPWLTLERVEREGALAVWAYRTKIPPPMMQPLVGQRIDGWLHLTAGTRGEQDIVPILYTFIEPRASVPAK